MSRTTRPRAPRVLVAAVVAATGLMAACTPGPANPSYQVDAAFGSSGRLDLPGVNGSSTYLPAADGGFFRLYKPGAAQVVERYTATGAEVTSFDEPGWMTGVNLAGERPDGTLVLVGNIASLVTLPAVVLLSPTGADTVLYLANPLNWQGGDVAPGGRFAAVGASCSSSSCSLRVQQYAADTTALALWSRPVPGLLGAYCSNARAALTEFDDGSAVVSVTRCAAGSPTSPIGVETLRFLPTGELDPAYGGGDGIAALTASDDGSTTAAMRQVVHSDDGSVLVLSEGGTARRLTPAGELDAAFGLVSLSGLVGGPVNGLTADGTGYAVSTVAPVGACGTGPATIQRISAAGATTGGSTVLPWSLDGGALHRYPDGRLLVSGATRAEQVNGDGTTSCVAPFAAHLTRLSPT